MVLNAVRDRQYYYDYPQDEKSYSNKITQTLT
jgi:hypothetical protein